MGVGSPGISVSARSSWASSRRCRSTSAEADPWRRAGSRGDGGSVSALADGATASHGMPLLASAVGTPWPSAFVGEAPRNPPIFFYRIFYRMVGHRVSRGGMSQHAVAVEAQVSEPVRPLAIPAVTPTKQLITRRSRVQIPPPPPSKCWSERVSLLRHPFVVLGVQPFCNPIRVGSGRARSVCGPG
jgi:hypothetical protein